MMRAGSPCPCHAAAARRTNRTRPLRPTRHAKPPRPSSGPQRAKSKARGPPLSLIHISEPTRPEPI
eukprot:7025541-Pyramimonas_sp.AAC.1